MTTEGAAAAAQPAGAPADSPAGCGADYGFGTCGTRRRACSGTARGPGSAAPATPRDRRCPVHAPTWPPINEPGFSRAHAGPSVRRFARELGVDLARVAGHGFKGRITHDDVKSLREGRFAGAAAAARRCRRRSGGGCPPTTPVVDFAQFGPVETQPLSRIQKISGPRLHASWVEHPARHAVRRGGHHRAGGAAHEPQGQGAGGGHQAHAAGLHHARLRQGAAGVPALQLLLDPAGANLILRKYVNIGFAADTPNGLIVPVVKDADRKDVYELARQLGELSEKARAGKLPVTDMQGGGFTISSLGGIGGTAFTPIINAPEVAILGVSRSAMRRSTTTAASCRA